MGLGIIIIDTILPIDSPLIRLFILGTSGGCIYLIGIFSFQKSFAKEILSLVLGKQ
jgi:hypothetical protein